MRKFIKEELNDKQGKTVLLTTHYMDEADELCDRIAFINRGKIVSAKTPGEHKRDMPDDEVLEVRCQGHPDIGPVEALAGVDRVAAECRAGVTTYRVVAPRIETVLSDVIEVLRKDAKILGVDVKEPTLEDVFLHVTGVSLGEDTSKPEE
jgi:ABC-2 type transport system ATP-binding protein